MPSVWYAAGGVDPAGALHLLKSYDWHHHHLRSLFLQQTLEQFNIIMFNNITIIMVPAYAGCRRKLLSVVELPYPSRLEIAYRPLREYSCTLRLF